MILFGRNVTEPAQTGALCARLRAPGARAADHGRPRRRAGVAAGRGGGATAGRLGAGRAGRCRADPVGVPRDRRRLAALGVTGCWPRSPTCWSDPRNPVIGARAFGGTPALCARHVAAAVTGLPRRRSGGLRQALARPWRHRDRQPPLAGGTAGYRVPRAVPGRAGRRGRRRDGRAPAGGADGRGRTASGDARLRPIWRARATLWPPAACAPLLVADDVTMGALRGPMRRPGVAGPDDLESGLVDPGTLPAAWLRASWLRPVANCCSSAASRGGPCLRPTNAGSGAGGGLLRAASRPPPAAILGRGSTSAPVGQRLPAGLATGCEDLVWLDATAGDRWGAADERRRPGVLGSPGRAVRLGAAAVTWTAGMRPAGRPRLLVTSHGPLAGPGGPACGGCRRLARGASACPWATRSWRRPRTALGRPALRQVLAVGARFCSGSGTPGNNLLTARWGAVILPAPESQGGGVVQLVRTPACQAGGREFESRRSRHLSTAAQVAVFCCPESRLLSHADARRGHVCDRSHRPRRRSVTMTRDHWPRGGRAVLRLAVAVMLATAAAA